MAATVLNDMIVPEIFNPYLVEETTKKSAFISSGIATSDPSVVLSEGGKTIQVPFFKDIDDDDEVLEDGGTGLTVHNIDSAKSVAAVHARGVAYGASDLSKVFSGADPMAAIAGKLGALWARKMQKVALSSLEGIFKLDAMADSVSDHSADVLSADMMADALFLLGDNFEKITSVAMSSAVLAKLKKLDLIDVIQPSTLEPSYYTYMQKRVIVDDSLAASAGVYPIYFFGTGALSYNENTAMAKVETERDAKKGFDNLYSRRYFTMHPRGLKWKGTPVGETPSNAELATKANWELAADRKNVAICLLKARVASGSPSTGSSS